ncbi:MAG TPA: imidazoleglycerol-phosphate dehydratase HisB [Acidobacteriota bacterium]|nr:imidazoleglycerol-phosphate dehydratase HisB [Acidobacteriota bacterium]
MSERTASITRTTSETDVRVTLNLDGAGTSRVKTGIPFLDHMLELFAKHGVFDLEVECKGDLHIDAHHSVEDIGICLGLALEKALGDKRGIVRFAHSYYPMDESLARVVVDLSGRPYLVYNVKLERDKVGSLDAELVEEFWKAVVTHARLNLHIELLYGRNTHHIVEAIFKAAARSVNAATRIDSRISGVPSTKGVL